MRRAICRGVNDEVTRVALKRETRRDRHRPDRVLTLEQRRWYLCRNSRAHRRISAYSPTRSTIHSSRPASNVDERDNAKLVRADRMGITPRYDHLQGLPLPDAVHRQHWAAREYPHCVRFHSHGSQTAVGLDHHHRLGHCGFVRAAHSRVHPLA